MLFVIKCILIKKKDIIRLFWSQSATFPAYRRTAAGLLLAQRGTQPLIL